MSGSISSELRRAADNARAKRKPIERGFTTRFLDPSINHDDINKFANGHGVTLLLEPGISVENAREPHAVALEVTNIIGKCTADLDAQFHDAYLVVQGVTRVELNNHEQAPFRKYIRRWSENNTLPIDPLVWKLAGKYPMWVRTFARHWTLLDSASFIRDCTRPRRRMENRTLDIPFVGVMNIDTLRRSY